MKRMLLPPIFVLAALLAFSLWNIRHMEGWQSLENPVPAKVHC